MKFTFASRPWSLSDSAVRLCDGADHLLHDHNCDEHGYETLIAARDSMREMLPELIDAQNIADFWAQAHADLERLTAERAALLAPVEGVDLEEVLRWVAVRADVLAVPRHAWTCGQRCDSEDLAERLAGVVPALAREVERLRAAVRFADEQGAEAIERVSSAIVADKWSATAAFQERALKAEAEVARLRAALEETRLTLAAEQGKPEGAPSDGWEFDGRDWSKNYTDGSFAGLSGRRGKRRWMRALWPDTERVPTYLGRGHDVETDRAAMLAADSATEAR